jgi:carbon-monoxide dehydrogenase large subunit
MNHNESTSLVGRSLLRREDQRFLCGKGKYVADLSLPDMLHAVFVRSQVAHGVIRSIDTTRAFDAPGVVCVLTGADLRKLMPVQPDGPIAFPAKWKSQVRHSFHNPRPPLLAQDKVRYVGEPVAVVIAESRSLAEDAAELISLDIEELEAVTDPEAALAPGATLIHPRFGTNLLGQFEVGKGNVDAALASAPRRLKQRIRHHRHAAMPLECRGLLAAYNSQTPNITVWATTQQVHFYRRELAQLLRMPEDLVRCIAPDIGGAFGSKSQGTEYLLVPFLARRLERPIRWLEDRREHFLSSPHARDQVHDVEVGFDDQGRILALKDSMLVDCGAWHAVPGIVAYNTATHLLGPYRVDHFSMRCRIATTNKMMTAAYRGAGRPEAVLVMERVLDLIAAELGCEPLEIRLRNMIAAEQMPYAVGVPYRDGEPIVYDSGDFPASLRAAIDAIGGIDGFRQRQRNERKRGRYIGLGMACYTEGTGIGPFEGVVLRIDSAGKLYVATGASPQGQGMETIFSQITADAWSVDPNDVTLVFGDTAAIATGTGTMASRVTVTVGSAIHFASERLRKKVFAIAAHNLECSADDLELRDGKVGIVGVPGRELSLAQVAAAARPGWDHGRPPDVEAGLEERYYYEPPTVTWGSAATVAIVEVDAETGHVSVEKIVMAHDCGRPVNAMLVEGQMLGGLLQGVGGALHESMVYDGNGQLITGSFMDYKLPVAGDMPQIELIHMNAPSPLNPLGVKGVGEGGAIAPPAAIANAVSDALSPFGVQINSTPVRPDVILEAMHKKRDKVSRSTDSE